MFLLVFFAFLAGIVTILAPCILPILPIVLSAGITGGRRRPIGIVAGLVVSFTFFTLALSYLVKHLGLSAELLRVIAIWILFAFGVVLMVPKLLTSFETLLSRFIPQGKSTSERTDFWGGILIGASLGLVWTPCVGPIIASVITLAATSSITYISVLITIAYVVGTSIPLLVIMYGSKRLIARIRGISKYTLRIQQVFGFIMILTAVAMLVGFDQIIEADLLAKLPSSISSGLTQQLEESSTVQNQLKKLKGNNVANIPSASQISTVGTSSGLPVLGQAPDFVGITGWLNSLPLTLAQLRGKVVLVDFWTYSCINCIRTLPHLISWYNTYKNQGFVVVGVEAPEFAFEKDTANVQQAINQFHIPYPVAQDNNLATWNAYNNEYWPAEYLIDAEGRIRATDFGEGDYSQTETNIRALLVEATKNAALPSNTPTIADLTPTENQSPETYLGSDRQSGFVENVDPNSLTTDSWTLKGSWQTSGQYITSGAAGDSISYNFIGKNAYIILNPPASGTVTVQVLLDGKPIGSQAGSDDVNGSITVNADRLYSIATVSDPSSSHLLTLIFSGAGVNAYTFTFG